MTALNWQEHYKSRLISHEEAAKKIQSNWNIGLCVGGTTTTTEMYNAITDRYKELENVFIVEALALSPNKLMDPKYNEMIWPNIKVSTGFALGPGRALFKEKLRDILIIQAYDTGEVVSTYTDCWFVHTTRPDKNGYVNLSICNFYHREAIKMGIESGRAKMVICECNDQLPVVYGDNYFHVSEFDYFVEVSQPLPTYSAASTEPSKDELSIAQYVADFIKDGDTLQIGIGAVPETVGRLIEGKHDLGIVTELFVNAHLELIEKGIVTNKKKNIFKDTTLMSFAMGDQKLYDYVTENVEAQMLCGSTLTNPFWIATNDNMLCMNTALLIDLTGQLTCEGMGHRQISGTGGQFGFQIGAKHSKGGRALTLLKAANIGPDGSLQSSILPELPLGTPVSVTRNYVDKVITEYGVADIKYLPARARADALIAIAHPDLRGELRKAARKNYYPKFAQEI